MWEGRIAMLDFFFKGTGGAENLGAGQGRAGEWSNFEQVVKLLMSNTCEY